jgi:hypothetical protein
MNAEKHFQKKTKGKGGKSYKNFSGNKEEGKYLLKYK